MLTNPYAFVDLWDDNPSDELVSSVSGISEIHVSHRKFLPVEFQHPNASLYCFNARQYESCVTYGWTPHVCLLGDGVLNGFMLQVPKVERETFWFPTRSQVDSDPELFSDALKSLDTPICVAFSPFFNPDAVCKESIEWLSSLLAIFDNPVFDNEISLYDENRHLDLICISQRNGIVSSCGMIHGVFGDFPIDNEAEFVKRNAIAMVKSNKCKNCRHFDSCSGKGIGYAMHAYGSDCAGIALFGKDLP